MKESAFRVQTKINLSLLNKINKSSEEFIESIPQTLEPKDIVEIMPIGRTKVYELLKRGRIPGHKIDGQWIIPKTLFLQWFYFGEFEAKNHVKKL
jgi:excisionase family DNA binding protein